jgi:hypothetical protein
LVQAGVTEQIARVATSRLPFAGGLGQQPLLAQVVAALGQPAAQPRPFSQQCFVRDLDRRRPG